MFVTASKTENQPMSILEAMSFGLPVVGAAAKGIPELVQHEHNGMLFEADNHEEMAKRMLRMSYKTKMCRRMGRKRNDHSCGFPDALCGRPTGEPLRANNSAQQEAIGRLRRFYFIHAK